MQRCLLYRGYDQTERRGGNFPGFFSYSADFFCTGELQGFLTINYGDFYSFISEGFPTFTELIRTAETILLKFTLKKSKLRKEMHCLKLFLLGKERKKTELEYKHTVCMVYPQ